MAYRVREIDGAEYFDELTALHKETFTDGSPVVDFEEGYWWAAFDGEIPVAFIGIKDSILGRHVGYFWRVGVLPSHRGNGLQQRLMRAMEAKAKKVGWVRIVTDTRNNPPSANNIIACGYRMFEPSDPWAASDAVYWTKELSHERQRRNTPRRYLAGNRERSRTRGRRTS